MKLLIFLSSIIFLSSEKIILFSAENVCVNDEEKELYNLIIEYRKGKSLKSIPLSAKLTHLAQVHTKDLSDNYKVSPKNKCNPHSWSGKGKWTSCCYTNDHKQAKCMWDKPKEISGYESPGYEIAYYNSLGARAPEALDRWKQSSAHNPLLINEGIWSKVEWNAIGVGVYKEYAVVWFGQMEDSDQPIACEE